MSHLPYTKKGLEDLAAAMGINTAYLWVSPVSQRLELKDAAVPALQTENQFGSEEEEEESIS